ncbi:MAG TPA: trypsin-like peptidase domain-containing protein [Candidatus Saccharimonadales bacterium]|nr:trypsin-like peptidase domain-containing protein [Candidatus Saccharimonadales bacterium]
MSAGSRESSDSQADASYSVSSDKVSANGRTVSFTVPTLPRPQLKTPSGQWRYGVVAVAFMVVAGASGFGGAWLENHHEDSGLFSSSLSGGKKIVTNQSELINQIAKMVGPSVVSVNVDITASSSDSGGFGLFGFSQPEQEEAAGTGVILSKSGIIMTNRHVVPEGTTKVSVTLSDGTELKDVSVIGRTSSSDSLDIAFLKINNLQGHTLKPAVIGDSSTVQVGDDVVAIGNALGQFQNTVTSGIISGYGRSVQASDSSGDSSSGEDLDDLFQTDAAINEGNSGGPLVNLNGQVIGINTAIAGDAQSIGFAIPVNDVQGLIKQVLKTGKFSRPYLGVRYIPLTADVADEYNLSTNSGAFIAQSNDSSTPSVIANGPAAKAGLKVKDIITAVNGAKIDQNHSLTSLIDQHQAGDRIGLTVLRNGKTIHLNVTLGTMPN